MPLEPGFEADVNIISPIGADGAVRVDVHDPHTRALDLVFIQAQGAPTTLTVQAEPEDVTITIANTAGFVDGNKVGVFSGAGEFYFGNQVGAPAGNVITLDTPIDKVFTIAGSAVITALYNMNVNGAIATEIFQIGPIAVAREIEIDVTRLLGYIQTSGSMDDAKFGDIAAGLANGVVLRHNNTAIDNVWNIKTNGEFGLLCFDTAYTANAPAGSEGFRFRNTYAGQAKHGVTIRLAPGDILELLIQDDLSSLEVFNMMAQGHIVGD